jgi:hypothetical protein
MDVLTSAQMEQLVRFGNKATGWILISLGAFLVALTETWTLRDVYDWPLAVYVVIVAVMLLASASYTAVRLRRTDDLMRQANRPGKPEPVTPTHRSRTPESRPECPGRDSAGRGR